MKQLILIFIIGISIFFAMPQLKIEFEEEPKFTNKVNVVHEYIYAHKYKNYDKIEELLLDPSDILAIKYTSVEFKDYKIISEKNNSVRISFKRFCYDDPEIDIIVIDNRIDFKSTLRNILSEERNSKANKKYCYNFEDKKLSGTLNRINFNFLNYFENKTKDTNGNISRIKRIFAEKCDFIEMKNCKNSVINLSELDLSSDGGNFSDNNYISIIDPKDKFEFIVTEGSYRITDEYNEYKIEISFNLDSNNYLNGYFYVKK